jgi:hypothetical protein
MLNIGLAFYAVGMAVAGPAAIAPGLSVVLDTGDFTVELAVEGERC